MADITRLLSRPLPPPPMISMDGLLVDQFEPAPEVKDWIESAYLTESGPLYTPDHAHLCAAMLAVLWTNVENKRHGRRIVGQAEMPGRGGGNGGRWSKARANLQLQEWFGYVPDFLITLDAVHAAEIGDAEFCALVDHELTHCAQAQDEFGMPRFNQQTGEPVWTIRGHDVEEFVSVVRRFGVEAAGPEATDMVIAAAKKPEIAAASMASACGTCVSRRAA